VENPFVNLLAIVGFLLFAVSLIPSIIYFGTKKARSPRE
jgi:hypothetical protein